MAETSELTTAVGELDDGYLKVLLLLSVRRASAEEPRRAAFWHTLAVALAEEQETRRGGAELAGKATASDGAGPAGPEVEQALDELLLDLTTLKSELRESAGDMPPAGD